MIDMLFIALFQAAGGDPQAAAPAAPAQQEATAPASEAPAPDAEYTLTCRMEPVTGSRVRRVRVCVTQAQRERASRKTQQEWRRGTERLAAPGLPPGG